MVRIGSFTPVAPVVLAPMAGVTNAPFRTLCREFAPGLVYVNEMVMATAVVHGNSKTERMMTFGADEQPRSLQIYGSDPAFAHALRAGEHGKLRIDASGLVPEEIESHVDLTGVAGNFWVGLAILHALFMLEHNAICDPSHQCVSAVTKVGGASPFVLGSRRVRGICIGCCGQGSSPASGIVHGASDSFLPWLNQSWTSNWIQAPASRFSVVAGMNSFRVISSRLTVRGFGSRSLSGGSG